MRNFNLFLRLIASFIFLTGCKSDNKLAPLQSVGTGSNANTLEIVSAVPDRGDVTIEIDDIENFSVSAVAPFPRTINYNWHLNNQKVSASTQYSLQGLVSNVGSYTLTVEVSDGVDRVERTWNIKVNGPPTITPITATTPTPKVSVGHQYTFQATASDPNSDSLTYTWLLNGESSLQLTGTQGNSTLTATEALVGSNVITLQVTDGGQTRSYNWTIEVNHLSQACNQLQTGQICTYAGGWHKGSGLSADNTQFPLRFRPYAHIQDALGNIFFSDLDNNVVWYWNRTGTSVNRIGQSVAANTIKVVAGTGEATSGAAGSPALQSGLNNPRGLWYDDANDKLYIAEYSGGTVKYIDTSGTVFIGMGGGSSNVDGQPAFNHACSQPVNLSYYSGQLYVSCSNTHRVKRWDLTSDNAYTAAGSGSNNATGQNTLATTSGAGRPYGIHATADGLYISLYEHHRVRFVNWSGSTIRFWQGTAHEVVVNNNNMSTILGSGTNGASGINTTPTAGNIGRPTQVFVRNSNQIYVAGQNNSHIVVANNSNTDFDVGNQTISAYSMSRIVANSSAGYNGSTSIINSTRVYHVYDMSIDRLDNDNILFSDYSNYRFRSFNPNTGDVNDLAGSGRGRNGFYGDVTLPSYLHLFDYPTGLKYEDSTGNLFVVDQNNHRVRIMDRYGRMSTAVGRGVGDPTAENDFPSNALIRSNYNTTNTLMTGVDLYSDGTLAQQNSYGFNVRLWNRSGVDKEYHNQFIFSDRISTVAGDWISGAGNGAPGVQALNVQLNYANSIRVYNDDLYIVDTFNHCVRKVDSTGLLTNFLGTCGTSGDPGNNVVAASALFDRPRDIAFDENGNVFVSDYTNNHIWLWNRSADPITIGVINIPSGNIAVIGCINGTAGSTSENVLSSSARCNQPIGLAYHDNRLCYAQRARHNVRCINLQNGLVQTVAGRVEVSPVGGTTFDDSQEGITALNATLQNPASIAFDGNGDLYISDTDNHVVRKVKLSP